MSGSFDGTTAPSSEEVALLQILEELEKAARASRAKCTSEALAIMSQRLRTIATELSQPHAAAVWHP
jgi:hypothetical protein